jgi:cytochrome c oxidase subunit 2
LGPARFISESSALQDALPEQPFHRLRESFMQKRYLILALLATLTGTHALIYKVQAEVAPRHIEVIAKRFAFEPTDITLKKGEPVVLVLRSVDVPHGLRFRELNVDVRAGKGGSSEVHFTPNQTGSFVGHCSVFCGMGHGSMSLKLHVVD